MAITQKTLEILQRPEIKALREEIGTASGAVNACNKSIFKGIVGEAETHDQFRDDLDDAFDRYFYAVCWALIEAKQPPYATRSGFDSCDWMREINAGFEANGHPPAIKFVED